MRSRWRRCLVTLVLAGCQGAGAPAATGGRDAAAGAGSAATGSAAAGAGDDGDPAADRAADASAERAGGDDTDLADPDVDLDQLGAIPAWQAVVDRAELLARRGQRAVVVGAVGPKVAPPPSDAGSAATEAGAPTGPGFGAGATAVGPALTWLIDDSEGAGTLAIRVAFRGAPPAPGTRVAVGGAWALDPDRRWYWQADALTPLPPMTRDVPPLPPGLVVTPGHRELTTAPLPPGARPVSKAKDDGVITFQVLGTPDAEGDGWRIADERGDPAVAFLYLPGERGSYGGRDMRADDERWQLKKGVTYWVQIGKVRRRSGEPPLRLNARTPPVKR
ncbi:MAG: hypothetical protein R2939_09080 [Kofleriaceae bacterium]